MFYFLINFLLLLLSFPSNFATFESTFDIPNTKNIFKFLPENGRIKYNLNEVKCKGNKVNGTDEGIGGQIVNCIGEFLVNVDAVEIPMGMKTFKYILPHPSESILAYEIHFGAFKGKFMGKLNWGGEWPKPNDRQFWIVLSRFGRFVNEGKFIEPRHLLSKGPVNMENGKFELKIEGKKPTAMYIWIYELFGCEEGEEEKCVQNIDKQQQQEENGNNNEKMSKLFHAIILENPSISGDEFQFEYEIDLNGADDSKMLEFAGRYTKIFRSEIEKRWDDWWDTENRQFRWAETVALRLQQIDFIFANNDGANGTIAISGKPAIEM